MTKRIVTRILLLSAWAVLPTLSGSAAIRSAPEYLNSAVVYQIVLRTFTREGSFKAATEMLGHVRSVGVDVVYLAPFVEMDRDMDECGWSPRQIKSGFHSPKNPYRISNYDKIDPEYGTDADFREFCDTAHALGMKVYMDLVYVHCGPNNVLKDMVPDALQKNSDGTVKTTKWRFPYLNFDSQGMRRYLVDSMLRWMRLGCDGFRCDTGDKVPLRVVNPALVMINEGVRPEYLLKAFNARYDWHWGRLRGYLVPAAVPQPMALPQIMDEVREYDAEAPNGGRSFVFLDNHDTAADAGENRFDRVLPVEAGNAAFVLTFLRRGLPLLFNGNEIADNSLSTFFAPVEDPARARRTVDWARALQPAGQKRLSLLRRLAKLRHEMPVISEGTQEWLKAGEAHGCVSFIRRHGDVSLFVAANLTDRAASFCVADGGKCATETLLAEGGSLAADGTCRLGPWAYIVSANQTK